MTTNHAAVTMDCGAGLTIYDLTKQTGVDATVPGGPSALYTAADPGKAFLVAQTAGPDFTSNNNMMSWVLVYNEAGRLTRALKCFNLFNTSLDITEHNLQFNPSTHTGWIVGPYQAELQPFATEGGRC